MLAGGRGADVLVGTQRFSDGDGHYTAAVFRDATRGVHVDLGAGTARGQGRDHLMLVDGVVGTPYRDVLVGGGLGPGDDVDDRLWGRDGDDVLKGERDWGRLNGGGGQDRLVGQTGQDELDGQQGDDLLLGGPGPDSLLGEGAAVDAEVVAGDDVLYGGNGRDILQADPYRYPSPGDDELHGGDGPDTLWADRPGERRGQMGGGDDRLYGDEGRDFLIADPANSDGGSDRLYGGAGDDSLDGGAWTDFGDGGAHDDGDSCVNLETAVGCEAR